MRSLTAFFVLLVVSMAPRSLAQAQSTESPSATGGSTSVSATKEEVNQLRGEVAAQRQTIEELKAMVQKLVDDQSRATDDNAAQIRHCAVLRGINKVTHK